MALIFVLYKHHFLTLLYNVCVSVPACISVSCIFSAIFILCTFQCTVIVKGDKLVMYQKAIKENEISSEVIREILSDGRLLAVSISFYQWM